MESLIEVEQLAKRYRDVVAVENVSLSVARGEIFGILGPNGAGKTTVVECIQGLRRSDGGRIRVLGLDPVTDHTRLRRRIGSQLQESALPDRMRVGEAVRLFGSLSPKQVDPQTLLAQWGLGPKMGSAFATLSGGQRQRLFVALALVNEPEVVFLDEMTTGLDPTARRVAWDLIRDVADRGTTVVLVTHFMDEAERLCDRVALIVTGRVVALGTPREVVNRFVPEMRVTFRTPLPDVAWLGEIPQVRSLRQRGERVEIEGIDPVLALVAAALVNKGAPPVDLNVEQPTLEDAFLRVTAASEG